MDAPSTPATHLANRYEANAGLHPWLSSSKPLSLMTGKELRALRNSLNLTQEEFASRIGMSRWTVMDSEKTRPSRFVEAAVYRALGEGRIKPAPKGRDRRFGPKGS